MNSIVELLKRRLGSIKSVFVTEFITQLTSYYLIATLRSFPTSHPCHGPSI